MKPVKFKGMNAKFIAPQGMTVDECADLPAYRSDDPPMIVSCWELTEDERIDIANKGRLFLGVMGTAMPPVWIAADNPFDQEGGNDAGQG